MSEILDAIIVLPPEQVHFMTRGQVDTGSKKVLYVSPFGHSTLGARTKSVVWAVDDEAIAQGSEVIAAALVESRNDLTLRLVPGGVTIGF